MEDIPCFNYESIPLEQKYEWMRSGPGGAASIGFGDDLARLAADFTATDVNIGQKLLRRGLGAEWQGQAATAADDALNRAAAVVAANAAPGNAGRDSAHRYGDSFEVAKNAIPPPPSVGQNSWWGSRADELGTALNETFGSTFGVQSDYAKRLAAHQTADQAANDALRQHESTTRTVLAAYQSAITGPSNVAGRTGGDNALPGGAVEARSDSAGPATVGGPGKPSPPGTPAEGPPGFIPLVPAAAGGPAGLVPAAGGGFVPAGPTPGAALDPRSLPVGRSGGSGPVSGSRSVGGPSAGGSRAGAPPESGAAAPRFGRTAPARGAAPLNGAPLNGGQSYGARAASPLGAEGTPGAHPPAPRGGAGLPIDRPPVAGFPAAGAVPPGGHPAGLGGVPMAGVGGIGGQRHEHRNTVFIPDDEPFRVEFEDLTPPVIGLPGDQ